MPVDPFGGSDYGGGYGYDEYDYGPPTSITDLISQGIYTAGQTAQIIGAGYPPGSTVVLAPNVGYPGRPGQPPVYPPAPFPTQQPQSQSGFSLTGNTGLWLLAGLALLVFSGRRR
jgi:hypothetical protein